jgi:3-phosphoshikimate 1-carboxyvinyltransferase
MSHAPSSENARPLGARKSPPLTGVAEVPGDKSISQRALILGALAEGETRITGLLESGDVHSTAGALRGLGASLTQDGPGRWRVVGTGVGGWKSPAEPLDFGNSGTGSRLVMGAMATTPITAVFTGDASLRSRPMARVVEPLLAFGVRNEGQGPKALMPLTLHGAARAQAIETHVKTASAQVKSALLLAALNAQGPTRIRQDVLTRDHSEKMLKAFGADITVTALSEGGEVITINGPARLTGSAVEVPRDPSSAAFPLVAALIVPGSRVELPAILLNPRRTGLIETLLEMGADIRIQNRRTSGGEEIGDLIVHHSRLNGVTVPASRSASMIDEYPILAVAAAFAVGETRMLGLEELRVKESDRLAAVAAGLAANGVPHTIENDDLIVHGLGPDGVPGGGMVATHMDHRIAMSFLTMGLASHQPVTVDDVTMIATSFPEYMDLMKGLGAEFTERPTKETGAVSA